MASIRYLSTDKVRDLHAEIMDAFGQQSILIFPDKLESACLRPAVDSFGVELYPTVMLKAAALLEGLCLAHAFQDGNKPIAFGAFLLFLRTNGVRAKPRRDHLENLVLAIANGTLRGVEDIAAVAEPLFFASE